MAEIVYTLCALTSIVCAALLLRSYARSRTRLLLWSSLCFVGFAFNNVLLIVDQLVLPQMDLSILRSGTSLLSVALLLFGLVWDRHE